MADYLTSPSNIEQVTDFGHVVTEIKRLREAREKIRLTRLKACEYQQEYIQRQKDKQ